MATRRILPTSFTTTRRLVLGVAPARTVTDAATNTDTSLTSATAAFTANDVGAGVTGTGIPAATTIVSVTNATTVVLNHATTATATGVSVTITPTSNVWAAGAVVPKAVVARIRHVSALLSRGWIYPTPDPYSRKLKSPSTPRPITLNAKERKDLGA